MIIAGSDDLDRLPFPKSWPVLAKRALVLVSSMLKVSFDSELGRRLDCASRHAREHAEHERLRLDNVNKIIATYADGKQVVFLDLAERFVDRNGGISKNVMPDGLHPSTKGFEIWARAMERPLKELLGEGKK